MALSKYWDNDIINDFNNSRLISYDPFNDDCMCMFSGSFDGRVNRDVAIFAKKNGRKEGLLYNNRLYVGVLNPLEFHKKQYEANRAWILSFYK